MEHHVVTLHPLTRKMMMTKGRWHSHGRHCLLLRGGWLSLLIGPVATDGARAKPFTIHRIQSLLGISPVRECNEPISTRAPGFHIPHDACFSHGAKGGEGLEQDIIVHLVAQITDEYMIVTSRIFLGWYVGLVGPIYTNFLSSSSSSVGIMYLFFFFFFAFASIDVRIGGYGVHSESAWLSQQRQDHQIRQSHSCILCC